MTPPYKRNGIVDGPFGSNLKKIHYRKSGIPIITSGYVTNGRFLAEEYLYVDNEKFQEEKRSAVYPGDIVMAKIGERCGASAIFPDTHEVGILSGNALKISLDPSRFSTFYVWQVLWNLHHSGKLESLRTVGAQPALSMANLKKYKVLVPPTKAEQEAIAEALSDADALIESLEQLLAKKRHIKQGAMQELLTGKKRLSGFSGVWAIRGFGEIAQPRKQRVDPRRGGIYEFCIELEHIEQGTGCLSGFVATGEASSLKSVFQKDDVLFGKLRAYLQKYWFADREGVCSTEIWALTANLSLLVPSFLFQIVKRSRFIDAASEAYGTHMPRSDWNVVKNYEVLLPLDRGASRHHRCPLRHGRRDRQAGNQTYRRPAN